MHNFTSPVQVQKSIATGNWKPNMYLTNLSTAYFQQDSDYVANRLVSYCASTNEYRALL